MGVTLQPIDLFQPDHMGFWLGSMSPANWSNNRRCRAGLTTPVTEKTAVVRVRSSGNDRVGFVVLPGKALTRDAALYVDPRTLLLLLQSLS